MKIGIIVKGSYQQEALRILEAGELLIQPFFPEIQEHGEWSLVFFGEHYSHAVRKIPAKGEYREQAQYGGGAIADTPSRDLIEQADAVRRSIARGVPYWIEHHNMLYINEVELIDPRLFYGFHEGAAQFCAEVLEELPLTSYTV